MASATGSAKDSEEHPFQREKNTFIKAALERMWAEEDNWMPGPNERTQYPTNLASEEEISSEPGEQNFESHNTISVGQLLQKRQQSHVSNHACKSNEYHQGQLH